MKSRCKIIATFLATHSFALWRHTLSKCVSRNDCDWKNKKSVRKISLHKKTMLCQKKLSQSQSNIVFPSKAESVLIRMYGITHRIFFVIFFECVIHKCPWLWLGFRLKLGISRFSKKILKSRNFKNISRFQMLEIAKWFQDFWISKFFSRIDRDSQHRKIHVTFYSTI